MPLKVPRALVRWASERRLGGGDEEGGGGVVGQTKGGNRESSGHPAVASVGSPFLLLLLLLLYPQLCSSPRFETRVPRRAVSCLARGPLPLNLSEEQGGLHNQGSKIPYLSPEFAL